MGVDTTPIGQLAAVAMEKVPQQLSNAEIDNVVIITCIRHGDDHSQTYVHVSSVDTAFHVKLGTIEAGLFAVRNTSDWRPGEPDG